jgi:hypothetical protein
MLRILFRALTGHNKSAQGGNAWVPKATALGSQRNAPGSRGNALRSACPELKGPGRSIPARERIYTRKPRMREDQIATNKNGPPGAFAPVGPCFK